MLSSRSLATLALVLLIGASPALAQQRDATLPRLSPNVSTSLTLGVTEIEIDYGAPSVRGRTVFGDLVPYDQVWRAGANEATTIRFSTDVMVEGQALEAGTYGLFAVPGERSWTFVFNDVPEQWGAYQYDTDRDVLRVTVTPESASFRETMAFGFGDFRLGEGRDAAVIYLHWADTRAAFRVETNTDAHVEAMADEAARGNDWERPLRYARYALQTGRHMDKATEWVDAAVMREANYATLSTQARLHASRGHHREAVAAGERALALGDAMAQPPRDLETLREEVAGWRADG